MSARALAISGEMVNQLGGMEQLGLLTNARRFRCAEGAREIVLIFDLSVTGCPATCCRIVYLTGPDYYELEFYDGFQLLQRWPEVYCDQLAEKFNEFSGAGLVPPVFSCQVMEWPEVPNEG